MRYGMVAEVDTPDHLLEVIRALRRHGFRKLDAFTPYVVPELEDVLELERPGTPWVVGMVGFAGAGAAFLVQWLCNAVWYPLNVGGRPPNSWQSFIIVTFVFSMLCAGTAGLLTFLRASRLPWLANPIFAAEGFDRASRDRFWLSIDASDPCLQGEPTERLLRALGAHHVQYVTPRGAFFSAP